MNPISNPIPVCSHTPDNILCSRPLGTCSNYLNSGIEFVYNTKLRRKCNPLFQFSVLLLLHYMFRSQSAIIRCITYVVATLHTIKNLKTPDFTVILVASSVGPIFIESPCWPCGLYLKSLFIFTRHFDLEFSIFKILKIYNLNIKFKKYWNLSCVLYISVECNRVLKYNIEITELDDVL
jgi:hypothetical protein